MSKLVSVLGVLSGAFAAVVFWLNCHFQYHEGVAALGVAFAALHLVDYSDTGGFHRNERNHRI